VVFSALGIVFAAFFPPLGKYRDIPNVLLDVLRSRSLCDCTLALRTVCTNDTIFEGEHGQKNVYDPAFFRRGGFHFDHNSVPHSRFSSIEEPRLDAYTDLATKDERLSVPGNRPSDVLASTWHYWN